MFCPARQATLCGSCIIPHALQMGWMESPGYFCATTETSRDIMQAHIDGSTLLPPHVFDSYMSPEVVVRCQSSPSTDKPWQMLAVCVDDYILAAVKSPEDSALLRTGRAHCTLSTVYSHPRPAPAMSTAKTQSR